MSQSEGSPRLRCQERQGPASENDNNTRATLELRTRAHLKQEQLERRNLSHRARTFLLCLAFEVWNHMRLHELHASQNLSVLKTG